MRTNRGLGVRPIAVGVLILAELLQGFRDNKDHRTAKSLFDDLIVSDLAGKEITTKSADNFRILRQIRNSHPLPVDVIFATFCIEKKLALLFLEARLQAIFKIPGAIYGLVFHLTATSQIQKYNLNSHRQ